MAQDREGYLWLASSAGLTRFDGTRFERYPVPRAQQILSASATSLFAPASGGLWVGFTFGGVGFLKDGELTFYQDPGGLPVSTAESFAEADDGSLWVATSRGLARFDGRVWTRMAGANYPSPQGTVSMLIDSDGTVWLISLGALYSMPRGAHDLTRIDTVADVSALAESLDGVLWMQDRSALRPLRRLLHKPLQPLSTGTGLMFDRSGALWSIDSQGLHRISAAELRRGDAVIARTIANDTMNESSGLTSSTAAEIFEDREGNIWVFTQNGLDRISETQLVHELGRTYSTATNRHLFQPLLVAAESHIWTSGEQGAGALVLNDGEVIQQPVGPGLIEAGCSGRDGSIFIATPTGIYRFHSGIVEAIPYPPGLAEPVVQSMVEGPDGNLWISVIQDHVYRRVAKHWNPYAGLPALPPGYATALSKDSNGRLWLGYRSGAVAVVDGDSTRLLEQQVHIGGVLAFYGMRSRLWVGGTFGLAVLDGANLREIETQHAGELYGVSGIVETAAGDLWLNGSAGLVQVPATELAHNSSDHKYKVKARVFAATEGVFGIEERLRPLPTLVEAADGRLWFSTSSEVYSIDVAHAHRNAVPPSIIIQSATADGHAYSAQGRVELPVHTRNLRIDFVGISLTLPEGVRYRYMLVGVDADWQQTAAGVRQASYTNLNPGEYRFQVDAANSDGVWNERGASLDISIAPAYYQTTGFKVVLWTLAFGTLPAVIALLSMLRSARETAKMRERINERERIARELHDTLIQDVEALGLNLRALKGSLEADDPARGELARLDTSAQRALESARDRVINLRSQGRDPHYLQHVLEELAQNLTGLYPTAFRVQLEGTPLRLESVATEEIVALGREAVLNAFRHARAQMITVSIAYGRRVFELQVVDDGKDVQQQSDEHSRPHWGVVGMKERAKKLRAEFRIDRAIGGGTTVNLRVPAYLAYAEDQMSRFDWYWLFVKFRFSRGK